MSRSEESRSTRPPAEPETAESRRLEEVSGLRERLARCDADRARLDALATAAAVEIRTLSRQLTRENEEKETLLRRIASLEDELEATRRRCHDAESRNDHLGSLYVASHQLHGSLDRAEILSTIREILINLVGTEEFAVFRTSPESGDLRLLTSFGVDDERVATLDLRLVEVARTGELFLAPDPEPPTEAPDPLVVAVPLHLGDRVTGVIAIYRLLPQKQGRFGELDRELCALLARQAAPAIWCASRRPTEPADEIRAW